MVKFNARISQLDSVKENFVLLSEEITEIKKNEQINKLQL